MKQILSILFLIIIILSPVKAQLPSDQLIRQGVSLHDQGKYMEAISLYQQAIKANPSSMSAVYEMSLSYLKMKDYKNAIKHSSQVINVGFRPLLVDAYVVKGTALAAQDKLDEAIELFSTAIAECGNEYLLLYNLGLCHYNNKNLNLAVFNLRKAIEIDATHSSAFLLYAYALNDLDMWVQSFYSFHFFLLLESNTHRSREAFGEMFNIINRDLDFDQYDVESEDGIDRRKIYEAIAVCKAKNGSREEQYRFFKEASKIIFAQVSAISAKSNRKKGVFWDFFVPVYDEVLRSGHFNTYCRYVSVAYFPESFDWWQTNKDEVDNFIEWFERGESPDAEGGEFDIDEDYE